MRRPVPSLASLMTRASVVSRANRHLPVASILRLAPPWRKISLRAVTASVVMMGGGA